MDLEKVDKIIENYKNDETFLIPILQDIQAIYNYLPKEALTHVAQKLSLPLIQVYGVATFFKAFHLTPRGKHIINVCLGTACHVRGAVNVLQKIERELGIKSGETTGDMQFTLETVNCLGACALGPIVVTDGEYHGQMDSSKVDSILKKFNSTKGGEDSG